MTTRSGRRRSTEQINAAIAEHAKAFSDAMRAPTPPAACPVCKEPHHQESAFAQLAPPSDPKSRSALADPIVADATWHVLIDSYRALATEEDQETAMELLGTIMSAVGFLIGAAEVRGEAAGVEKFFDRLVRKQGYGTFQITIGPDHLRARRLDA